MTDGITEPINYESDIRKRFFKPRPIQQHYERGYAESENKIRYKMSNQELKIICYADDTMVMAETHKNYCFRSRPQYSNITFTINDEKM